MSRKSKYYYTRLTFESESRRPNLKKLSKYYEVELDEEVEDHQYINLIVNKFSGNSSYVPKITKYEIVKPLLEELFNDYYKYAIKIISTIEVDGGEYYLLKNSESWFEVEYYSGNEKDKRSLSIDFRDDIGGLDLTLYSRRGYSGRPTVRRNGSPITNKKFKQFLNLTMKFLSDQNSYKVYLDSYLKDFYSLTKGDNAIIEFELSTERAYKEIFYLLESRKTTIEKRLIENDQDSPEDRIRLRGEIDGINYALGSIKINKDQ